MTLSTVATAVSTTGSNSATAYHPGATRQQVQDTCGWKVLFADQVEETPPPSELELTTLRALHARTERAHAAKKEN